MAIIKIVSGGQTGDDGDALERRWPSALHTGVGAPGIGWQMMESSQINIPIPLPQGGYRERTWLNMVDSDGTVILFYELLSSGTRLTRNLCALLKRPYVLVDAWRLSSAEAMAAVEKFVDSEQIQILKVAGPTARSRIDGYAYTLAVIKQVIVRGREGTNKSCSDERDLRSERLYAT